MSSDSEQSPGPISRNDLENYTDKRTFNSYNDGNMDTNASINLRNELNRNDAVYRRAFDVVMKENHALEKENEILRKFLLLKKENCDLKTLDIITSALSMCDEKLNEFIQRMHYDKLLLEEARNDKTPVRVAAYDKEPFSPSYGASFREINFSELGESNDGTNSLQMSVPRTPISSKKPFGISVKDASPSYGQSFPELDTNELLDGPAYSIEPVSDQCTRSKLPPYPLYDKYPVDYIDTNPYPVIQKDSIETKDSRNNIRNQAGSADASYYKTQDALRNSIKYNDISTVPEWKVRDSYGIEPGPAYPSPDRKDPSSLMYGLHTDKRCQSAPPVKQLDFKPAQQKPNGNIVHKSYRMNDAPLDTFTTLDKEQARSRLVKVIPRMTSTPKDKRQTSPKLRSAPATLNQPRKSSFKPIQQPHMRFSLESPRRYPKKPSPVQDKVENKKGQDYDAPKSTNLMEPLSKSQKQDMIPNTTVQNNVFYDSLEQDDTVLEAHDVYEYNKGMNAFDNTSSVSSRPQADITRDKSVYYTPSAFTEYPQTKDEPVKVSERFTDKQTARQYIPPHIRPATGNVESRLASTPIYVSSGTRTHKDYPNIAKAITTRSMNYGPQMFPSEYSQSSFQTNGYYKSAAEKPRPQNFISAPEKDTGIGEDFQKTSCDTSERVRDQSGRPTDNINSYQYRDNIQSPREADTSPRVPRRAHDFKTSTRAPVDFDANTTYEITEIDDNEDNGNDNQEDESVWINITQRGKTLNEVYEKQIKASEKEFSKQYQTSKQFDNRNRTDIENASKADDPVMTEFSAVGSPLHTSTPVAGDRSKRKRFDSAKQTNASPIVNDAIGSSMKDKPKVSPVQRLSFEQNGGEIHALHENVTEYQNNKIKPDLTGSQEFDMSLIEAVTQRESTSGRSEQVKSVLYRPVDTLTGYSPNVTADLTDTVLGSRPNRRLAGEIAFQLDRRIMELVIGLKKQSNGSKTQRSRYYGYSLVNISQLIKKQALHSSHGNLEEAERIERDLQIRLENIDTMLKPLGFNLAFHAQFTQDIVNKYGLMKEAPDRNTVEGFGLSEPVVLRMLLGRILGHGLVLDNILILLDCLCFLSHSDRTPLFMW